MNIDLKKQMTTKGYIERFWDNLMKVGKEKLTKQYLEVRLALLETYWTRFEDCHYDLIGREGDDIKEYIEKDMFTTTEEYYISIKTRIKAKLDKASASKADQATAFLKQIQLPKISLPTFSGDQLAWETFRDLFKSLVDEVPDLAPVQKLQYLKASLTEEAASVVANLELTDKGYTTAWTELNTRYDNKRVLLATYMRAFINSAVINKASPSELKRIISLALQARRSFESLGRPVEHWDDWFVYIVVEKLDSSSRLYWEASLQTSTEFPTFTTFQEFLQTRIRALDAAQSRGSSTSTATPASKPPKGSVRVDRLCQRRLWIVTTLPDMPGQPYIQLLPAL